MGDQQEYLFLQRFRKVKLLERTYTKSIWLLVNVNSGEKAIAKIQPKAKLEKSNFRNVLNQASYQQILQGHIGIPFMFWSGVDEEQIMIIAQYLGQTLQKHLAVCSGKFSLKTTCVLGIKIIKLINNYHHKGILHRNLKPSSLQFGRGSKVNKLYFNDLIDSKRFRSKKNHQHIIYKQSVQYHFVNKFGSVNFKKNREISRRDDIQSIIILLIYFYTGILPDSNNKFGEAKYPSTFSDMIKQAQSLEFNEEPNYVWFINKLQSLLFHNSYAEDEVYDWMRLKKHQQKHIVSPNIISIKTEYDKLATKQLYTPFEAEIDIDDVSTKYLKKFEQEQTSFQRRENIINKIEAKKNQKTEHKNTEQTNTKKKIEQPRGRRHKQKDDCSIM